MGRKKRLQELTLKNNFMFGAVMTDEEICRHFLEMVLGFSIERVEVSREKYVIFICDYDPCGKKKYVYTFKNQCKEDSDITLDDGVHTIYLSTRGENKEEVPRELVKFLEYVEADLSKSTADFGDDFVSKLQKAVDYIKRNREMEERYMLFEELLQNERKEGKIEDRVESIIELLEDLGPVPEKLKERLEKETDMNTLKKWHKLAARAESIEQFETEMEM